MDQYNDEELWKIWMESVYYLTILINSKDVIIFDKSTIPRERSVSTKLKGAPLFSYRTLKIKPERIVELQSSSSVISYDEEPAYSQRYHFRLGHWRHLSDGSKVAVRGYWAGNLELGAIEKEYDCIDLPRLDLFGIADGKRPWTKPMVVQDLFA